MYNLCSMYHEKTKTHRSLKRKVYLLYFLKYWGSCVMWIVSSELGKHLSQTFQKLHMPSKH